MKRKKFTVRQVADALGVSRQQIHKFLKNYRVCVEDYGAMFLINDTELHKIPSWREMHVKKKGKKVINVKRRSSGRVA